MVKTIMDLDEKEDQIVNIVKAINKLKSKTQAIKFIISDYNSKVLLSQGVIGALFEESTESSKEKQKA